MKQQTKKKWQKIIEEFQSSSKNVTNFCKDRRVTKSTFYQMRTRLNIKLRATKNSFIKATVTPKQNIQSIQTISIEYNNKIKIKFSQDTNLNLITDFVKQLAA